MTIDRLQKQRFEIKYLVDEAAATALQQFIRCYLRRDEFASASGRRDYPVHSLYLDSPGLATFQAVKHGEKNRFKLRVRYYDDRDRAVFFEIKRRVNDVIQKVRARVWRECVRPLLAGEPPSRRHLERPDEAQLAALQEFCRLMHRLSATPRSHVAYWREAWMGPINNTLRITFDRRVQCEPEFGDALTTAFAAPVEPFGAAVIFELKFVDRLPAWCLEMVRAQGLVRGGAPKYAQGVLTLGEERVADRPDASRTPPASRACGAPPAVSVVAPALPRPA